MTDRPRHTSRLEDLLLSPSLTREQAVSLLDPFGFKNPAQADANIQLIADEARSRQLLADCIRQLLTQLALSEDPDIALSYFERFVKASIDRVQLYTFLNASPVALELIATTVGSSPFMTEILIRNPSYFYWLSDPAVLRGNVTKAALMTECASITDAMSTMDAKLNALRRLKRREMLRIGVKDLLRVVSVRQTTSALSVLADVLIQHVYAICDRRLSAQYGNPSYRNAENRRVRSTFAVLAMGKLGGRELNFSSDVDIMYLYSSDEGMTTGSSASDPSSRISTTDYFHRLSQDITTALSEVTQAGYLFRVDLNLRPEGKGGPIATSLLTYQHYYQTRGETWERLALLKARPVAGDLSLGRNFVSTVSSFVRQPPFTVTELAEVRHIKNRINKKMATRGAEYRNVKLGIGGIREVEFIVQALQLMFGHDHPGIHDRHTDSALRKLYREGILPEDDYRILSKAYVFYRDVEHKLQMVEDAQTHTLPQDPRKFQRCALMLRYRDTQDRTAADQLRADDVRYSEKVNQVFRKLFEPV